MQFAITGFLRDGLGRILVNPAITRAVVPLLWVGFPAKGNVAGSMGHAFSESRIFNGDSLTVIFTGCLLAEAFLVMLIILTHRRVKK